MNWKSIVKNVAPVLGTALGGPFGGMATKAIANAVIGETELTGPDLEAELESVITGDRDALLKIKELDKQFDRDMKQLDVDILAIEAEDRASARQLAEKTSLKPQIILASVYVLAFAVILVIVFTGQIELSDQQSDMANILIGILSAGLLQIMNFFYGSSSGSKEKTAKLRV